MVREADTRVAISTAKTTTTSYRIIVFCFFVGKVVLPLAGYNQRSLLVS
jgi:hypothetical protein